MNPAAWVERHARRRPGDPALADGDRVHASWGEFARFKRPKDYRFVGALPTNNYGKVVKRRAARPAPGRTGRRQVALKPDPGRAAAEPGEEAGCSRPCPLLSSALPRPQARGRGRRASQPQRWPCQATNAP